MNGKLRKRSEEGRERTGGKQIARSDPFIPRLKQRGRFLWAWENFCSHAEVPRAVAKNFVVWPEALGAECARRRWEFFGRGARTRVLLGEKAQTEGELKEEKKWTHSRKLFSSNPNQRADEISNF